MHYQRNIVLKVYHCTRYFQFQIPTATNGPIKFGIVENSEYNDTPSERCSSGNAYQCHSFNYLWFYWLRRLFRSTCYARCVYGILFYVTNGPIKFGIVENSEYNDTPSERCSSGNASIIINNNILWLSRDLC
jgi:hypothetical protein